MHGISERTWLILRWLMLQASIISVISIAITAITKPSATQELIQLLLINLIMTVCCSVFIQICLWLGMRWDGTAKSLDAESLPASYWQRWHFWPSLPVATIALMTGTLLGVLTGRGIGVFIFQFESKQFFSLSTHEILASTLFALIPGTFAALYLIGKARLQAAISDAQKARRIAAENQLRLLESQLEPHMLFNTLANLRVLIGMDTKRAQVMLDHIVAFLRATLTASRTDNHPLRLEFARISEYLALMKIRMSGRLQVQLELPPELEEILIAPLLLQPLIENAIKHGLELKIEGGVLCVCASIESHFLLLDVHDTGVGCADMGFNQPASDTGSYFGLQQVRERLAVKYGKLATLSITPATGSQPGTWARIKIPVAALDQSSYPIN